MPLRRNQSASTCSTLATSSGYVSAAAAAALALSHPLIGGPARPTPAGPVNPAWISPAFIMLCSDLPSGACTTLGGSLSAVTCSSSSTTQVTLEESNPYSLMKMPRVHTPVVTE